jgi:hypothetical protein
VQGRRPARKTGNSQIKTTPEKVHRAVFALETGPKIGKYIMDAYQGLPKVVHYSGIITAGCMVLGKRYGWVNFVGYSVYSYIYSGLLKGIYQIRIKFGYRFTAYGKIELCPLAGSYLYLVTDEIKVDLENTTGIWHAAGS